jgi:hypothetical protein
MVRVEQGLLQNAAKQRDETPCDFEKTGLSMDTNSVSSLAEKNSV